MGSLFAGTFFIFFYIDSGWKGMFSLVSILFAVGKLIQVTDSGTHYFFNPFYGKPLDWVWIGFVIRGCVQRSLQQGREGGGLKGAKKCGRQ